MNDIVEVIDKVGFPIFTVLVLFWQNSEMRKKFDSEQKDLQKLISENSLVLAKLSANLDRFIEGREGYHEPQK